MSFSTHLIGIPTIIGYEILGAPLEDFNHIDWFPVDQAILKLKRGSHKWGVTTWQDYLNSL